MDSFIRGYKIPSPKKYGVFLSFRGIDVRKTFVDHLYQSLTDAGINVYMDERSMEKGVSIDDALEQAIEDSAISIPIFSTNYASSPNCLQELTHMCKSKAEIKPLFYDVQPYQVRYADNQPRLASEARAEDESEARREEKEGRAEGESEIRTEGESEARADSKCEARAENQRNGRAEEESEARAEGERETNPYSEALKEHRRKGRYLHSIIDVWGRSLKEVSNLNGWTRESTCGYEGRLVKQIVCDVIKELDKFPYQSLPTHPMQLDKRIQQVIRLLDIDNKEDVLKIGIWGLNGIGKTTVAKAVFNCISRGFDAYCFLSDVSAKWEHKDGLKELQEQLMRDIHSRKDCRFNAPDEGRSVVAQVSVPKRTLIVLDDIVDRKQLEILTGQNWAGPGSRVIVTTPDKHVLNMAQINAIYKMEGLEYDEALSLFSWHAFLSSEPDARYAHQCKRIVEACDGLPLALEVVGDLLGDRRDNLECWNEALSTPQCICHQQIYSVLRPSYEKLSFQEKKIFVQIACSYIGKETEHGIRHWKMFNWDAHMAIRNLELKSLIRISDDDKFMMHSLVRDMGEAISQAEQTGNCCLQIRASISNIHIKCPPYKRSEKKRCRTQNQNRQNFSPGDVSDMKFIEGAEKFELQDFRRASPVPLGSSASVFGTSYKVPLSENRIVVVKELTVDVSSKGDFEKVMELSAKLKHRNVAGIEAFYYSQESKFVVQNYFPYGSLHHLIHGNNARSSLSWESYRNIALGVAKGLCFIHDHSIHAHGNLKSSNILLDLLDDKMEACISDFIPRILLSPNSTTCKNRGYNFLEYTKNGNVTKESDVFAYGVLLLEILTGQDPPQSQSKDNISSLTQWVQCMLSTEWISKVICQINIGSWEKYEEILNMYAIADHCVSKSPQQRPTIKRVLEMFESEGRVKFSSGKIYYCSYFNIMNFSK